MASPQFPFYFAWVDPTETTFGPEHEVVDEDVIAFELNHEEGQYPTCDITIKNPHIGLLNPARKTWAWLSWQQNPSTVTPLFFGVLVGIPANLLGETVTLKFIAQPENYIEKRQAVAETMKIRPYYDPFWLDDKKRDDPDSILEGWSSLWHIDRTTLVTTASDILDGEAGLIDFSEAEVFYENVEVTFGQPPLTSVNVKASARWTQRQSGYVDMGSQSFVSYTGGSLVQEWPKPGQGLGSGWRVQSSFVRDVYAIDHTPSVSTNGDWHNTSLNKLQCTPDSSTMAVTFPAILSPNAIQAVLTSQFTTGVCDPFSDPQTNRPASIHTTGVMVPLWYVTGSMKLRYDARRQRNEELIFAVTADTQSILTAPTLEQRSELITIESVDLGEPVVDVMAWSDFAGLPVAVGQVVFPNDPSHIGEKSYQICVQAGTAGAIEPAFSDIVGTITIDGTVHWASLGDNPLQIQNDWNAAADVPVGEIICFKNMVFNPATSTFEDVPNATSYYMCTTAGRTNAAFSFLTYTIPAVNSDQVSTPNQHYSYIPRPTFSTTPGQLISDGSVVWTVLGVSPNCLSIPLGGTPENVPARCYFPTDRGHWSVEYLISLARARLRHRARAVSVKARVPFAAASVLSCRHNATIHDRRLPGQQATGKVIAYSLKCDGQTGDFYGEVHIGCAVGHGGHISDFEGEGVYASTGYMQNGYQQMEGAIAALPGADINYTPPVFEPDDDGLVFPLTRSQIIVSENINGDPDSQAAAIRAAIPASVALANNTAAPDQLYQMYGVPNNSSRYNLGNVGDNTGAWAQVNAQIYWTAKAIPQAMESNPVWYQLELKPVQNGPFSSGYSIGVSPLKIPQGIDLEAASSP